MNSPIPVVLSIAGSDSSGGAGLQADLKTFAAFGVHGVSVVTAVTAQNTSRVEAVFTLPAHQIVAQLRAVLADTPVTAIKLGMLGNVECVRVVIDCLREHHFAHVILDPVMIATSGDRLLGQAGVDLLRNELLPLTSIITPNILEAECLLDRRLHSQADMLAAAQELRGLGCAAVLLKGAHMAGTEVEDWYVDANHSLCFRHPRLQIEGHGTGCTLASALAAGLALGHSAELAARNAIDYVQAGLKSAIHPGKGSAVLGNFRSNQGRFTNTSADQDPSAKTTS
ncbi:bifunctional hydroxymethylpyrimidine kinase/phosphomethylpyrimidine kinase [Pseudolysobacter antarcticus]|uniref:hydroxymethylpyrimidine kinase n=2 Tax=Pseudolysobacter antarcticus TaxID=2511995 RepID=A0A411HQA0_9GAMM|nr:bifunctional hydroxymethylpyrimidine kinase/phosphomethylpyrimidine kinase [Pseudolysobacter antarcticus]